MDAPLVGSATDHITTDISTGGPSWPSLPSDRLSLHRYLFGSVNTSPTLAAQDLIIGSSTNWIQTECLK